MPQLTISKCSRYAWAYLLWGKVFGDTYQRSIVFAHAIYIVLREVKRIYQLKYN